MHLPLDSTGQQLLNKQANAHNSRYRLQSLLPHLNKQATCCIQQLLNKQATCHFCQNLNQHEHDEWFILHAHTLLRRPFLTTADCVSDTPARLLSPETADRASSITWGQPLQHYYFTPICVSYCSNQQLCGLVCHTCDKCCLLLFLTLCCRSHSSYALPCRTCMHHLLTNNITGRTNK